MSINTGFYQRFIQITPARSLYHDEFDVRVRVNPAGNQFVLLDDIYETVCPQNNICVYLDSAGMIPVHSFGSNSGPRYIKVYQLPLYYEEVNREDNNRYNRFSANHMTYHYEVTASPSSSSSPLPHLPPRARAPLQRPIEHYPQQQQQQHQGLGQGSTPPVLPVYQYPSNSPFGPQYQATGQSIPFPSSANPAQEPFNPTSSVYRPSTVNHARAELLDILKYVEDSTEDIISKMIDHRDGSSRGEGLTESTLHIPHFCNDNFNDGRAGSADGGSSPESGPHFNPGSPSEYQQQEHQAEGHGSPEDGSGST
ncbi:hypothetical protein BGZ96_003466, partial [Linnemannia gamsii]